MKNLFVLLSFGLSIFTFNLHATEIGGILKQGGFVHGKTNPNAVVKLGNYKTTADNDGIFVLGIPRLQNIESALIITEKEKETRIPLIIEQRSYKEQRITGVAKKHVNPNPVQLKTIQKESGEIKFARAHASNLKSIFGPFIKPVKEYRVSGVYGSRRFFNDEERSWHKGLDMAAPTGTPVYAPADGVVRLALQDSFFNGNLIIIDHGYNMMTIYAHLNTMAVKVGDYVKQAEKIGTVGATGRATGPHLHWGLYWRNIALDPELLLAQETTDLN